MQMILNDRPVSMPDEEADEPLLFVLRDRFALNGPKFGCGVGSCGACAVLVDGAVQRACLLTAGDVRGSDVVTLEGLADANGLHPVQQAWIEHSVPQCGYCQNGQIITAVGLLAADPRADEAALSEAMDTVVCRCGSQARIRQAIGTAARRLREAG